MAAGAVGGAPDGRLQRRAAVRHQLRRRVPRRLRRRRRRRHAVGHLEGERRDDERRAADRPEAENLGKLGYAFVQPMGPNSVPRDAGQADFDGGRAGATSSTAPPRCGRSRCSSRGGRRPGAASPSELPRGRRGELERRGESSRDSAAISHSRERAVLHNQSDRPWSAGSPARRVGTRAPSRAAAAARAEIEAFARAVVTRLWLSPTASGLQDGEEHRPPQPHRHRGRRAPRHLPQRPRDYDVGARHADCGAAEARARAGDGGTRRQPQVDAGAPLAVEAERRRPARRGRQLRRRPPSPRVESALGGD